MELDNSNTKKSGNELVIYAVIGLVAFCVFANTFGHGFVYDDNRQILRNPLIQNSELYGKALTSDVWAFKGGGEIAASNYFRPTFVGWMIVNWRLFGASASGWHVTNVLLHVGVCLLLFAFLVRLGSEQYTAATIALLFAVHPVHVENVAWISGVTDPLLSLFLLISLILARVYVDAKAARSSQKHLTTLLALSVITYLLAIGAKEIALFCAPVYWLIFRSRSDAKISSKAATGLTLPFLGAAIAYFIARITVLGAVMLPVEDPIRNGYAFLSIPKLFVFYLRQIFFPVSLGPALPIRPADGFDLVEVLVPLVVSIAVMTILWRLARRSETQLIGLVLFIVTLLPVLNPANFGTEQLAHDRYLYLPLAGLLMVIVPAISRLLEQKGIGRNPLVLATIGAILLVIGFKTLSYNRVWRDSEALWRYAVSVDPGSSHVWQNLGGSAANPRESLDAFERSLQIKNNSIGFVGKSRSLIALGRFEEATVPARVVITGDPAEVNAYSLFQAYEAETLALANLGRYGEAEASLRTARDRLPIYYAALTEKLAVVLYTQNRKQETLAELEAVRTRARGEYLSESKLVFLRLGMLYDEVGKKTEAKRALEEFLSTTADLQDPAAAADRRMAIDLLRKVSSP